MRIIHRILFMALSLMFASCTPVIVGSWNVERYETNGFSSQSSVLNNIGTMSFNRNGYGQKQINYNIVGTAKKDTTDFTWKADKQYIELYSAGSAFSKIWILEKNKNKKQIWKSTDGAGQIQTLTLVKIPD